MGAESYKLYYLRFYDKTFHYEKDNRNATKYLIGY